MGLYFLACCGVLGCFSAIFFFPFGVSGPCLRIFFDLVVTLNDYSHDSVDPRLLNFHHNSGLSDSAVFPVEKVQQAVVVDSHVRMHVDILGHVI